NREPSKAQVAKWEKAVAKEFEVLNQKLWTLKELYILGGFLLTGLILTFYLLRGQLFTGIRSAAPIGDSTTFVWISFLLGGGLILFLFDALMKNKLGKNRNSVIRIF